MNRSIMVTAIAAAFLGAAMFALGIGLAIHFYDQGNPPYSFANHFISELGWIKKSEKAWFFNYGMMAGCFLSMPLVCLLGVRLGTRLGRVAMVLGVCTALAGGMVGVFSLDNLLPHLVAALLYFWGSLVSIVLFTLAFYLDRQRQSGRLVVIAGMVSVFCSTAFLAFPKTSLVMAAKNLHSFKRPDVWWLAVLEWSVCISMGLWVASAVIVLGRDLVKVANVRE